MKPFVHATSSARRYGGKPEDYLEIHNLLDASKGAIGDGRHRALTHTTWFLSNILERIFGVTITNSANRVVSVRDIGEQHILEDYGGRFIPTAQDFLEGIPFQDWMLNGKGEAPASVKELDKHARTTRAVARSTRHDGQDHQTAAEGRGDTGSGPVQADLPEAPGTGAV